MSAFVYFVRAGDFIKIGWARDVDARVDALQVASPVELRLLGTVEGSYDVERLMHSRFAHLRARGEWFRAEPDLLAYIAEHCGRSCTFVNDDDRIVLADLTLEAARFAVERACALDASTDSVTRARARVVLGNLVRRIAQCTGVKA